MMHSKKKIIGRVVLVVLILAISGVWLAGYIDVNKRFPKPEQQIHSTGEWIKTGNVSIKVNSAEYMPRRRQTVNMDRSFLPPTVKLIIL